MSAAMRRMLRMYLRVVGRLTLIIGLIASTIGANAQIVGAQDVTPDIATIERGRVVVLALKTAVDSESSHAGDRVELQFAQPLVIGGKVVLPAGSVVPAHISKVRHAGKKNCRNGYVSWKLDTMKALGGTRMKLVLLRGRPHGPHGKAAQKVQVKSAAQKFGRLVEDVEIAPVFAIELVLFLPEGIAMAVGEGEPCRGRPGAAESFPAGTLSFAAVAHDVRISVSPAPAP